MDIREFNKLKDIDMEEAKMDIVTSLRNNTNTDDKLANIVSYAYIALILKSVDSKESVLSYLEENIKDQTTNTYLKKFMNLISFSDIEQFSKKYQIDTLKAIVLFSEPTRFTESDYITTPEGVSNLALKLLDIKSEDVVLDLGSGVNSFLIQAGLTSIPKLLYGAEIDTSCVIISNIRSAVADLPINICQGNILSQDFSELGANKVFSNPPLGVKWIKIEDNVKRNKNLSKYFTNTKRTVSGDWAYALSALLNQKKPGKTVVLMTNAGTWNESDKEIRKTLIEKGLIEGVISLPGNLFSFTYTSLTMMIFSEGNENIRMVDATQIYSEGRRLNSLEIDDVNKIMAAYYEDSDISRSVSIREIQNQEYIINPQRYVGFSTEIENSITLGEVCKSINRGTMITSKELDELSTTEDTGLYYLALKDIQDGVIDSNLLNLSRIDEKYLKYCIRDNNLIISKTSPFKVAMAHVPDDKTILANGNLYFIELDESKINPTFVEVFLQSETGIGQLNRYAKGAVIKNISIKDLKEVKIPNLPRAEQDRIAEEYLMLNEELAILQRQIDLIKDKKARLVKEVI